MAANEKKTIAELQKQLNQIQASTNLNDKEKESAAKRIAQAIKEQRVETELLLKSTKEYDDILHSIGSSYGKNNKLFKESEKILSNASLQVKGMLSLSEKLGKTNKQYKSDIAEAARGYQKVNASVMTSLDTVIKTGKGEKDILKAVEKQAKAHQGLIKKMKPKTEAERKTLDLLNKQVATMKHLGAAAEAAAKDIQKMHKGSEALSESSLGGKMNEFFKFNKMIGGKTGSISDIYKSAASNRAGNLGGNVPKAGTKGNPVLKGGKKLYGKAAEAALKSGSGQAAVAATAESAGGLIGSLGVMMSIVAPILGIVALLYMAFEFWNSGGAAKAMAQAKMVTGNSMLGKAGTKDMRKALEGTEDVRKINAEYSYIKPLELKQEHEKALYDWEAEHDKQLLQYRQSLVTDGINFEFELRKEAYEGERARSKSLYLTNMSQFKSSIGISEQALQAIGSSTDSVLDSVKELGAQLGTSLKEQISMAASAAGLGKLYQSSGTEILKMSRNFRLMDKSSSKVAFNNIAGLSAFAELNQISPGELFKQMADASEEVMKYSNMTTSQYANQAVLLSNMNTSMKDMAAASGTMVLNYKDSIKSEMSLSAMLGKNVNLSEVRARLMSGDMAGGASALKSALGGTDIGSMNAFQKQALSQSTGMGIEQLMELTQSKGGGAKGTLSEKAGIKTGQDIAKGAREMDISTKRELLAMEQGQRLKMLDIEHQHRLAQIQKEEHWKVLWEMTYGKEQALDMNAQQALAKAAENPVVYSELQRKGTFNTANAFGQMGLSTGGVGTKQVNPQTAAIMGQLEEKKAKIDQYDKAREGFWGYITEWTTDIIPESAQLKKEIASLESQLKVGEHGGTTSPVGNYVTPIVKDTANYANKTMLNTSDQLKQMDELTMVQTSGYTELLKRVDVTNELMSQLIDTTWAGAGQQIHMDGTRVGKVLKSISNKNYGIGVTTSTAMGH